MPGDHYNRRVVSPDRFLCGCYWRRTAWGDVLLECSIHKAATAAAVAKFEREEKLRGQ